MACSTHSTQTQTSELWITYNQASHMHEHVTTQLIDISDDAHLYLEDVLDHVFEQGFVDPKLRSVVWWEDSTSVRLKASSAVQDLLLRGAGSTPETALRLIIEDIPTTIWVHYEYADGAHPDTATQRFRLDPPHCERLTHLTEHIFAKGYLPCKARSLVSWKGACGKHVKENAEVEDVLSWGEGLCEEKPLRLVIRHSESTANARNFQMAPRIPAPAESRETGFCGEIDALPDTCDGRQPHFPLPMA